MDIKEYHKQYYRIHREKIKQRSTKHRQLHKEGLKQYHKQYRQTHEEEARQYQKQYRQTHEEEARQYQKQYHQTHKEELKQYQRQYQRQYLQTEHGRELHQTTSQRRRHRLKGLPHDLTLMDWRDVKAIFDYRCAYCGKPLHRFHQEHIVALVNGGAYVRGVIIPACGSCNSSKNDSDLLDWYPMQPFYTKERLQKIYDEMEAHPSEYTDELRKRINLFLAVR